MVHTKVVTLPQSLLQSQIRTTHTHSSHLCYNMPAIKFYKLHRTKTDLDWRVICLLLVNIKLLLFSFNCNLLYAVLQEQYEFALAAVAQEIHSLLLPSTIQ